MFLIVRSSRLQLVLDETVDKGEAIKDAGDEETVVEVDPGEGVSYFLFWLLLCALQLSFINPVSTARLLVLPLTQPLSKERRYTPIENVQSAHQLNITSFDQNNQTFFRFVNTIASVTKS